MLIKMFGISSRSPLEHDFEICIVSSAYGPKIFLMAAFAPWSNGKVVCM